MKNSFSKLIFAAFIASSPLFSSAAEGIPTVRKSKTKAEATKKTPITAEAKEEGQQPATNAALVAILNQIVLAKLDFDLNLNFKVTQDKDGTSKSAIDFKYLDISAIVKFKDQILYSFINEKTNEQLKKVIPEIKFNTKDMYVVSKVKTGTDGKMKLSVRFCQSYSINNDFCNTLDDKKLLELSVNSINFGMFDMRIKDIHLDFEQKLSDGKFSFSGSCTAWKSGFDIQTPDKTIMKPATCEFSGVYDSKAAVKFDGNFKLKSKLQ